MWRCLIAMPPMKPAKAAPSKQRASGTAPAKTSRKYHPKSRDRWNRILEVATELFLERGFAGTSMQDISDKVELKKGSLYYYVESKEQLLFEILRDLHHGGVALVANVNFESNDPLGELRAFLVQICIYAGKHADRLGIFQRDFDFLDAEQQREIIVERFMYRDSAVKLLDRAVALGQVAPALHVKSAAQVVLRGAATVSEWFRPGGELAIEQVAVQTAKLMIAGLTNYE